MPYCVQCGNQVDDADQFCARCGHQQGAAASPGRAVPPRDSFTGLSPRMASLLCYIPLLGWLMSLLVLATPHLRRDRAVRFHAFQGLYLFVAWLLLDWFLKPLFHMGVVPHIQRIVPDVLQLAVLAGWIIMLIKTGQNERYHLPIVGELAERSVAEQV